jgi:hypothetical protein
VEVDAGVYEDDCWWVGLLVSWMVWWVFVVSGSQRMVSYIRGERNFRR